MFLSPLVIVAVWACIFLVMGVWLLWLPLGFVCDRWNKMGADL